MPLPYWHMIVTRACAGAVLWRLEYRHMGSPGALCLVSGVNDPGAVFALSGKVGRSPRVFAARDRDGILRQMQAAALKRMGITLAGRYEPSCAPKQCPSEPRRPTHGRASLQSSSEASACCQASLMCRGSPAVPEQNSISRSSARPRSLQNRPALSIGIRLAFSMTCCKPT